MKLVSVFLDGWGKWAYTPFYANKMLNNEYNILLWYTLYNRFLNFNCSMSPSLRRLLSQRLELSLGVILLGQVTMVATGILSPVHFSKRCNRSRATKHLKKCALMLSSRRGKAGRAFSLLLVILKAASMLHRPRYMLMMSRSVTGRSSSNRLSLGTSHIKEH